MFEHRVENRQQFAHTGDQRHLAFFAARTQGLVRVPDDRVTAGGRQGRHVQRRAHGGAAAPTRAGPRIVPLSRLRGGATPTWAAMKTVSHFNFGIAVELMLKLLLYAHGKDVEKGHSLSDLYDDLPPTVQEELDATYRSIRHKLIGTSAMIAHVSLPPSEPLPEPPPSLKRDLSSIRKFFAFFDQDVRLSGKRYSYELIQQRQWRLYLSDISVFFTFVELVMGNLERYIDLEARVRDKEQGTQGTGLPRPSQEG